jgi:hypothetical protein
MHPVRRDIRARDQARHRSMGNMAKDNHADLGHASTATPQPSPNRDAVVQNQRNRARRARGRAGEGFQDERDDYAQTGFGQAGFRDANGEKQDTNRAAKTDGNRKHTG